MTDPIVLDSSALLALLNEEPGAEAVAAVLDRAAVSSANLAEIAAKLAEKGLNGAEVREVLAIVLDVRSLTTDQAFAAGALRVPTRHLGLSLGDRACLALAMELKTAAMTCDRPWADIDPAALGGARVELVR